jgi:hypothetical protein
MAALTVFLIIRPALLSGYEQPLARESREAIT